MSPFGNAGVLVVTYRDRTTKRLRLVLQSDFDDIHARLTARQTARFRVYVSIPSAEPGKPEALDNCDVVETLFPERVHSVELVERRQVDIGRILPLRPVPALR